MYYSKVIDKTKNSYVKHYNDSGAMFIIIQTSRIVTKLLQSLLQPFHVNSLVIIDIKIHPTCTKNNHMTFVL